MLSDYPPPPVCVSSFTDRAQQLAHYTRDLRQALAGIRHGEEIQIPQSLDLHRRKPGAHYHDTPEFFYQTGGATDFDCGAAPFRLRTGGVCVIPRGVAHRENPLNSPTPYSVLVCIHARDGFLLHRGRLLDGKISGHATVHLPSPRGRDAFRHLDQMADSNWMTHGDRPQFVANLMQAFLLILLNESLRPSALQDAPSVLVTEVERLARANLGNPELSAARLAASLHRSPDYLSRLYRRERGRTLTSWIVSERIACACDLLLNSSHNIAEISWACGFSTPSYFNRVFVQQMRQTPRDYRRSHQRTTATETA